MVYTDDSLTWTDLWAECTDRLGNSDEARQIIEQASGRTGASWLITMTLQAPQSAIIRVREMLERRVAGEPLQYVVGRWGFRQLNLRVDRRVLIPRPETEQVVEAALAVIAHQQGPVVADLGTGSGAIALSIAMETEGALVYATDNSDGALELADRNLGDLPDTVQQRVRTVKGSWFEALPNEARGRLDMIVSNPPYVAENERDTVERQVLDWEPLEALFAGPDGMDAIEVIVRGAPEWLHHNGALVMEIAPQQAEDVERLATEAGFVSVEIGRDLSQRKRWLRAKGTR